MRAFWPAADSGATVAVDSTGLSDFDRSARYEKRLDDFGAGRSRSFHALVCSQSSVMMVSTLVIAAFGNL